MFGIPLSPMPEYTLDYLRGRLATEKGKWRSIAIAAGMSTSVLHRIATGETSNPTLNNFNAIVRYYKDLDANHNPKPGRRNANVT
jgi:hypothetical protein